MLLESFRIFNFRSINDSGDIEVSRITALLGRNESGKSNILLALRTLNPVEGFKALNPTKDFPRHRKLKECSDDTQVVSSLWRLTPDEQRALVKILPRAANVTHVTIGRGYGAKHTVDFDLPKLEFNEADVQNRVATIVIAVNAAGQSLDENKKPVLEAGVKAFGAVGVVSGTKEEWATTAPSKIAALRQAITATTFQLDETQEAKIVEIEELARTIGGDEQGKGAAIKWAVEKLPVFIFLDEYPELAGHQNIAQYLSRKSQGQLTVSDMNFEKLCKVADLAPSQLSELQSQAKYEERNQIANRASSVVTAEIKRLWKDRPLKIRFNLDAEHFDTFVSDPTSTFEVEVNLDERSRGFRWFFSFYVTFSADTAGGRAENSILLLDEPGTYLHIQSQKDLQVHFEKDFKNQIVYTTHSPFMVPIQTLDCLRTVNVGEDTGTTVTNNPTGDSRTLAPIRAALGYNFADSLFIGPNNLIVEGVTDWWIIDAVSKHFLSAGKLGLPMGLSVCPVDGAPKVPSMVSLLTAQKLNVLVLLDDEKQARSIRDEMISSKLIREQSVVFVSDAIKTNKPAEADIEDLLDAGIYEALVRESYAKELNGKTLTLNQNIPRIVKRLEAGFLEAELTFHKTRPAGLFFRKMSIDPASVLPNEAAERFGELFAIINDRLQKLIGRAAEPFH